MDNLSLTGTVGDNFVGGITKWNAGLHIILKWGNVYTPRNILQSDTITECAAPNFTG